MVSTRGASRVSARKQTARPARIGVAPKPTGGRTVLNSPMAVIRGATRPPRRALTEVKPIPICLLGVWAGSVAMAWTPPKGLAMPGGGGDRVERREGSCLGKPSRCPPEVPGALPCLPQGTHLISVGYSSPVNRYTQMKELARQPLPSAAWAVRRVCISGGGDRAQKGNREAQVGSGRSRGLRREKGGRRKQEEA